jgi:hypothetical protein
MKTFRACAVLLVVNLKFILAVDAKPIEEVGILAPPRFQFLQNGDWQSEDNAG